MIWIPLVTFLLHVAEEYPGFPAWATKHFGVTSRAWYVYSHVVLIGALVAITALANGTGPRSVPRLLLLAVQWTLFTNALFHVFATWRFRAYSPGVATGAALFVPATAYTFWHTLDESLVGGARLAMMVALGTVLGAAVVASLYLRMDIDWRLRRGAGAG